MTEAATVPCKATTECLDHALDILECTIEVLAEPRSDASELRTFTLKFSYGATHVDESFVHEIHLFVRRSELLVDAGDKVHHSEDADGDCAGRHS
jgi:hypothetical protein